MSVKLEAVVPTMLEVDPKEQVIAALVTIMSAELELELPMGVEPPGWV